MQSQRSSAAAQLQQLQQMQAQLRQQQSSAGNSNGPNSGNSASSQLMGANRGMGSMAQNIPQLPPHQMLSSHGNQQQWQQGQQQLGNQQSGNGIGLNNMSFPLMANQQLQQQLQSQLLSSQQNSSGNSGQGKNQQQAQAALYWNAMNASGNSMNTSGKGTSSLGNTQGNFSLNVGNVGNMDLMNSNNSIQSSNLHMLQQQQQHQMSSFMGSSNQQHQLQQQYQQMGNSSLNQDQSHLSGNMLGSSAPTPAATSDSQLGGSSMDFSNMNFNFPQSQSSQASSSVAQNSSNMANATPDVSSAQKSQSQLNSAELLIQQQKLIAQLQRQIQQFTAAGSSSSTPVPNSTDTAPSGQGKSSFLTQASPVSNRLNQSSDASSSLNAGNFLGQSQVGMNQSMGQNQQLQTGYGQNNQQMSGNNFLNNKQFLSSPNNLSGNGINSSLLNNMNQSPSVSSIMSNDKGNKIGNNLSLEMLKQQQQQLMNSNDPTNLSRLTNPNMPNPMFPKVASNQQNFDMSQKQKVQSENSSNSSSRLSDQQLFEWQLKNFNMINRLNQQQPGKTGDPSTTNSLQSKVGLPNDPQSKPDGTDVDVFDDDKEDVSVSGGKRKLNAKNLGKKSDKLAVKVPNKGITKNQLKPPGKVLMKGKGENPEQDDTEEYCKEITFSDPSLILLDSSTQPKSLDNKQYAGGWQSNADLPDRRKIIVEIVRAIEKMRPDVNKMSQKLPLMARKLEEHLYHSAPTKEEYVDSSTLKKRLQMIAHGLGVRNSASDSVGADSVSSMNQNNDFNEIGRGLDAQSIMSSLKPPQLNSNHNDPTSSQVQDNLFPMQQMQQQFANQSGGNSFEPNGNSNNNISLQIQQQLNMLKQKQQQLSSDGLGSFSNDITQNQNQRQGSFTNQQNLLMQLQQQQQPDNQSHLKNMLNMNSENKTDAMGNNLNQLLMQQYHGQQKPSTGTDTQMPNLLNNDSFQKLLQKKNQGLQDGNNNVAMDQTQDSLRSPMNQSQGRSKDKSDSLQRSSYVGSKTSDSKTGGKDSSSDTPDELSIAQKKKVVRQQQHRLLLLRHASKCTLGAACKTNFCAQMVPLWKHMKKCRNKSCTVPHCLSSRCVLNHYRLCKAEGRTNSCEVCAPVIKQIKCQAQQKGDQPLELESQGKDETDPLLQDSSGTNLDTVDETKSSNDSGNSSTMNPLSKIKPQSTPSLAATSSTNLPLPRSDQVAGTKTDSASEQSLQQKQLVLHQLHMQITQLQEQQKDLMLQQQQVQPNSPQARQVQQQMSLLLQLQQLFQQQQQLVQNEVKQMTLNNPSPTSNISEPLSEEKKDSSKQNVDSASTDDGSKNSKANNKMRRSSSIKRGKTDVLPSTSGNSRGKAIRKGGKNLVKPKDADASEGVPSMHKKRMSLEIPALPSSFGASASDGGFAGMKQNSSSDLPKEKKQKLEQVQSSLPSMDSFRSQQMNSFSGPGPVPSSSDVKTEDDELKEKPLQQQPGYVESSISCSTSMSAQAVDEHIESLESQSGLSPKQVTTKCLPIVEKLIGDPYGWVFRDPVDPVELGIPDYFDIIKEPMDLSLIKRKLENNEYKSIESFERETKLVFDNSILYNGENSDVGDMAKTLSTILKKELKLLSKELKSEQQLMKKTGDSCVLCGSTHRAFEPVMLSCAGSCGAPIRNGAEYFSDQFKFNNWCDMCYKNLSENSPVFVNNGVEVKKSDLMRCIHNEVQDEAWVQCDVCNSWMHQICALYNGPKEKKEKFTCIKCHSNMRGTPTLETPSAVWKGAKDLPVCELSEFLENNLRRRLDNENKEKSKLNGYNFQAAMQFEGLSIRVVSNVKKNVVVHKEMFERYGGQCYPRRFPYRSKCIVMFQKINGVDVMIFGMFVDEFGDRCPPPNRRRVYLSYLDSVKYMAPSSYRTMVYQSIVIDYLQFVKRKGFHTAHIWSCPPANGYDYIFYSHPDNQRIPNIETLRKWYAILLEKAQNEGTVINVNTFHEEYFQHDDMYSSNARMNDAKNLPYFDGDFVPGALETIIKEAKTSLGKDKIMSRLSEVMSNIKQNFFVVHLLSRKFALACDRGENVTGWSEDNDNMMNLLQAKARGSFISTKIEDSKIIGDATDSTRVLDNVIFESRHHFVSFCKENHFQFDELRRAKHSSMVILHQLHNPVAAQFFPQCGACYQEISVGTRYRCNDRPNYDLCENCYQPIISGIWAQRDPRFAQEASFSYTAIKCEPSSRNYLMSNEEQENYVKTHLEILLHAASCQNAPPCNSNNCKRMKLVFEHVKNSKRSSEKGDKICGRFFSLLSIHSRTCMQLPGKCAIPFCDVLREKYRRVQEKKDFVDEIRRSAQNELMKSS